MLSPGPPLLLTTSFYGTFRNAISTEMFPPLSNILEGSQGVQKSLGRAAIHKFLSLGSRQGGRLKAGLCLSMAAIQTIEQRPEHCAEAPSVTYSYVQRSETLLSSPSERLNPPRQLLPETSLR